MIDYSEYAEEGLYTKKEKSASSLLFTFIFSHFGLFILVILYAIGGAHAFVAIEHPNEMLMYEVKTTRALQVNDATKYMANLFWYYQGRNWTDFMSYNLTVYRDLTKLEAFLISSVQNYGYDGTVYNWMQRWTVPNALLFTITIMTTIGYGNIFPVTEYGKLFCIFYSITSCPLLLVFLGNLGSSMAHAFTYIYSRCCCRWCRGRRNYEELPANASKKQLRLLIDDEIGEEEYMPTSKVDVPITINLVLLFMYMMMGSRLFMYWEGWTLGSSTYFTFVTISTIGYGDMIPSAAILDSLTFSAHTFKFLICIVYILLGMAILSMSINLMQEQLIAKCRWFSAQVGLSKPKEVEEIKPEVNTNNDKKKKKKKKDKKNTDSREPEKPLLPADDGAPAGASRTASATSRLSAAMPMPESEIPNALSTMP